MPSVLSNRRVAAALFRQAARMVREAQGELAREPGIDYDVFNAWCERTNAARLDTLADELEFPRAEKPTVENVEWGAPHYGRTSA